MPNTIIVLLVTAPILALSMILGADWSPETFAAVRLALVASVVIVILWLIVEAVRAVADRWRRFNSRPY